MKNKKSNLDQKRIMILAGGTGGHIFPALTVADRLTEKGFEVFWLGTENGLETKLVKGRYPLDFIPMKGLRNKGIKRYFAMPFVLLKSVLASYKIFRKRKINLVLGFGGYVAAPGGIAAKLYLKPLIIHEQNARSGLTNRVLAKIANRVLSAFPVAKLSKKAKVIGNPLRREIIDIYHKEKIFPRLPQRRPFHILITGGSQGASIFNQLLPEVFAKLSKDYLLSIYHQSGVKEVNETQTAYKQYDCQAEVVPFIDKIDKYYQWADVIICRSGALTVSEVAACGIPAIFIPYPYAVDDHQFYNAERLVKASASVCIRQELLSAGELISILSSWFQSSEKLSKLSQNAKKKALINAADEVVNEVIKFLG